MRRKEREGVLILRGGKTGGVPASLHSSSILKLHPREEGRDTITNRTSFAISPSGKRGNEKKQLELLACAKGTAG